MPKNEKDNDCCTDEKLERNETECHDECCMNEKLKQSEVNSTGACCDDELKENNQGNRVNKSYQIEGMDCGNCALTLEKAINQLHGIQMVTVNFSTGTMKILADDQVNLQEIPATVAKLGYKIANQPKLDIIKIKGMDCGGCAQTIEKHFSTLPQVGKVSVSFATGTMQIEHALAIKDIKHELKKIGYSGSIEETHDSKTSFFIVDGNQVVIISGLLLILGYFTSIISASFFSNLFFALSMIISGSRPAKSAYYTLKSISLDMNVLMISAAIGAGVIGEWSEGALVVFLFAIGSLLQNKAVEKTRNSIKSLLDLTPEVTQVKQGDRFIEKQVTDIQLDDVIFVKAGERIPLDGVVLKGNSSVDQAPITGESIPITKVVTDAVFAGTINQEGSLEIKVTHLSGESTIARIIQMVEEAQEKKAPSEAFVDQFAKIYTPIVFIMALAVMIVPPLFSQSSFSEWFYKGLELLVVACPCALIISTPVTIVSAIGTAAKNGILIKGGNYLEKAGSLTAIAFDKTGTITEGRPKVSKVQGYGETETEVLRLLAALEVHTTHPIGQAIVTYATEKQVPILAATAFQNISGKGVTGDISEVTYFAGNVALFEKDILTPEQMQQVKQFQSSGHTIVLLGTATRVLGLVAVADSIRQSSKQAIENLQELGIRQTIMLTGDNQGAAQEIAQKTGVTTVYANLLPEEKVQRIEQLKNDGEVVAMVGDGINDAPALALSDVGIAMGGVGTDTAIETADIVLMADNLTQLPFTVELSKKAQKIIKQNITFSLLVKLIALLFIFPGWLTLWIAVLSDSGSAILVTLNALRVIKKEEY
ncbi:heavy metal translocating P-type ATPase [Enterococcus camelliae]|uniref:Cd(2+)-exporting ATPase n=1 Tax=Enterococcus camelliae TaxID=453959 RepID=A0ABW5THS3_9ENTE